jgi:hypothetical protein
MTKLPRGTCGHLRMNLLQLRYSYMTETKPPPIYFRSTEEYAIEYQEIVRIAGFAVADQ